MSLWQHGINKIWHHSSENHHKKQLFARRY
jgi:hypothetical protein